MTLGRVTIGTLALASAGLMLTPSMSTPAQTRIPIPHSTTSLVATSAPVSTVPSEQARSADGFVDTMGVNTHLGYLDTVYSSGFSTIIAPMLQKSGLRHVRDGGSVLWDPQWMRIVYDRVNQLATTLGRRIGFTVVMSSMNGSCDMAHPPVATLLRYLDVTNIDAFEGPNERDLNSPCTNTGLSNQWAIEVGIFQRALFDTVRSSSATTNIPVVGASLGGATWTNSPSVIGDQSTSVDFGNQHSYPGGSYPSTGIKANLAILKSVFGTKAQYATETGYHNLTTYESRLQQGVSELASGK